MTKIILRGLGALGSAVCASAQNSPNAEIVCGVDPAANSAGFTFPVCADICKCDVKADAVVDCTVAGHVPPVLEYCKKHKLPLIICTTGLSNEVSEMVKAASAETAVLQSANMSLGINLLADLVRRASEILSDSMFDIEIIEKHHNKKIDAPSGTALMLADAVNVGNKYEYVYNRSKVRQKRKSNEIGIHALRGGSIVGEHSVIFAGNGEVIEFKHSALSKEVFAAGVLKAASYIKNKPPGLYTMQNIIDEVV